MRSRATIFVQLLIAAAILNSLTSIATSAAAEQYEHDEDEEWVEISPDDIKLGDEYSEYERSGPKRSGGSQSGRSTLEAVLMYLPNRIFDLIDIVHVDLGVGPSFGGVVRTTKWVQVGHREFYPGSLRVGLRGRRLPIFWENTRGSGFGSRYRSDKARTVDDFEFGAGLDLFVAGGYAGISLDEAADFVGGIFTIDFKDDDL